MPDLISLQMARTRVPEISSFTVTAYFRDRETGQGEAPDTAEYRIEDPDHGTVIRGWTSLTLSTDPDPPTNSIGIIIAASDNSVTADRASERRRLTVATNRDTSTEARGTIDWVVENTNQGQGGTFTMSGGDSSGSSAEAEAAAARAEAAAAEAEAAQAAAEAAQALAEAAAEAAEAATTSGDISGDLTVDPEVDDLGSLFGNPVGGRKGAGTVNAMALYQNGTALSDLIGVSTDSDRKTPVPGAYTDIKIVTLPQIAAGGTFYEDVYGPQIEDAGDERIATGGVLKGVVCQFYLAHLYAGDFSQIEALRQIAEDNDLQFIIHVKHRSFADTAQFTNALAGWTQNNQYYHTNNNTSGTYWTLWRSAPMTAMAGIVAALGSQFDDFDNVEGIMHNETANGMVGALETPTGYSPELFRDAIRTYLSNARTAFPRSNVFFNQNFLDGHNSYLTDIIRELVPSLDIVTGGPDLLKGRPQTQSGFQDAMERYPVARSLGGLTFCAMQDDSYNEQVVGAPGTYYTVEEQSEYGIDTLKLGYIMYRRENDVGDHYTYDDDVIPYLAAGGPAFVTTRIQVINSDLQVDPNATGEGSVFGGADEGGRGAGTLNSKGYYVDGANAANLSPERSSGTVVVAEVTEDQVLVSNTYVDAAEMTGIALDANTLYFISGHILSRNNDDATPTDPDFKLKLVFDQPLQGGVIYAPDGSVHGTPAEPFLELNEYLFNITVISSDRTQNFSGWIRTNYANATTAKMQVAQQVTDANAPTLLRAGSVLVFREANRVFDNYPLLGTEQGSGAVVVADKKADQSLVSSTYADVTDLAAFALKADTIYFFSGEIRLRRNGAVTDNPDMKFRLSLDQACQAGQLYRETGVAFGTTRWSTVTDDFEYNLTVSASDRTQKFTGYIRTNLSTATVCKLQAAQSTTDAANPVLLRLGSKITFREMPGFLKRVIPQGLSIIKATDNTTINGAYTTDTELSVPAISALRAGIQYEVRGRLYVLTNTTSQLKLRLLSIGSPTATVAQSVITIKQTPASPAVMTSVDYMGSSTTVTDHLLLTAMSGATTSIIAIDIGGWIKTTGADDFRPGLQFGVVAGSTANTCYAGSWWEFRPIN